MVDPLSNLGEDVTEENAPRCVMCADPIVRSRTHRVVTRIENGEIVTMDFCTPACRDEWSGSQSQ